MKNTYLVKEENEERLYSEIVLAESIQTLKLIAHPIREKILSLIAVKAMYPAEIARELKMSEQTVYYHVNKLIEADIIEVKEKKEVRGTTAKMFTLKGDGVAIKFTKTWSALKEIKNKTRNIKLEGFLSPFIEKNKLTAPIIVGSPDPHGPFKARARDGHYATDLSLFLGQFCQTPEEFCVKLDVDANEQEHNMIVVGGPITNLVARSINEALPVKFLEKKPFGLVSTKTNKEYSDDSIGIVCRIKNPFDESKQIMYLAGITNIGTKSAVIALTRHYPSLLQSFTGQKEWCSVVQGFDLDGDGKIDSIEILE